MQINVLAELKNIDGSPIEGQSVTIRNVLMTALLATSAADEPDGEEKFKRYQLAQRIQSLESIELTAEEAAKLKRLVGIGYGVVVIGQIYPLLNGDLINI